MNCKEYIDHKFIADPISASKQTTQWINGLKSMGYDTAREPIACVVEGCKYETTLQANEYIATDGNIYANTSEPSDELRDREGELWR